MYILICKIMIRYLRFKFIVECKFKTQWLCKMYTKNVLNTVKFKLRRFLKKH